jgi:hypothetical protein
VSSKSTFAVLIAALAAIFLAFLKETYWFVLIELAFDHLASFLGVEKAQMIAGAAPYVVSALAASVIVTVAYRVGVRDRVLKPSLEILYDPTDPNYMRPVTSLYGPTAERYSIGVLNKGNATLYDVTVRALDSWFTQEAIAPSHTLSPPIGSHKPVCVFQKDELHPHSSDFAELTGIAYQSASSHQEYIFNTVQRFTLEALARDTPAIRREFEFDPKARPMVRMLP